MAGSGGSCGRRRGQLFAAGRLVGCRFSSISTFITQRIRYPGAGGFSRMMILHLADYEAPYGGFFIPRLLKAIEAARARGWPSKVFFPEGARNRPWLQDLESRSIEVSLIPERSRWTTAFWVAGQVNRSSEGTILHCHFAQYDLSGLLAAELTRKTGVIWHVDNTLDEGVAVRIRNTVKFGLFGHRVDAMLCVAPDVVWSVRSRLAPSHRTLLLPSAIDTTRFDLSSSEERLGAREALSVPVNSRVILHFGWDWHRKGGDLFLSAIRLLIDRGHDIAAITVAGQRARTEVQQLRLETCVRVLDPVPDPRALYAAADIFMSPSRGEGMPNSIIESLCMGTAVVATDLVGQETVGKGLGACRLTPADPVLLADAVEDILELDPLERAEAAELARAAMVAGFDLNVWGERLMEVYRQVAARWTN